MPFQVALFEPEIPPNTGAIMRLCSNTGCDLHLIEPLGFSLDERRLRRAGLDYGDWSDVAVHANWSAFQAANGPRRVWAFSTKGTRSLFEASFAAADTLLFGPESRGLPDARLGELPASQVLRLPMQAGSRSLNLANAVAVAVYEAWRQLDFPGAQRT